MSTLSIHLVLAVGVVSTYSEQCALDHEVGVEVEREQGLHLRLCDPCLEPLPKLLVGSMSRVCSYISLLTPYVQLLGIHHNQANLI